jgi:uncharacterized protein YjbJ (UPF0337 family)
MGSSIRDNAESRLHIVKKKACQILGKLNDNPKLGAEGSAEKISGKAQEKVSQIERFFGK